MASGRPRRPNDPSVMASVHTALSSVARHRPAAPPGQGVAGWPYLNRDVDADPEEPAL